jgi:hypothetical protein
VKLKDEPGATVKDAGATAMWSSCGVGGAGGGVVGGVVGGGVGEVGVVVGGVVAGGVVDPVGEVEIVVVRVPHPAKSAVAKRNDPIVSRGRFDI